MLTLRKYSRLNKIKNRHIITMGYKSKKINKRRYFKRHSRKRMYGGDDSKSIDNELNNSLLSKVTEKVEPPTVIENLKDIGNLGVSLATNIVADGINSTAKSLNIDPNKSASETVYEISKSAEKIVDVLNSPEGEQLKKEASKVLAESIDIAKPSIEKGEEIVVDGMKKLADTGTSIVMTALNELPPIFLVNELSKFGTAAAQAGETVAELTKTGAEAVESLQEQKKKAESLWGRATDLFNNTSEYMNTEAKKVIDKAQEGINKYGENIVKEGIKNFPKAPEMSVNPKISLNDNISPLVQAAGGSLKKYKSEAKMIGGRILHSQSEFLNGYLFSSQNLKQYEGKGETKRRNNLKRKITSRRH